MKKLLAVLLVLAFMVPTMAMADDTLDVSGAFRLEYYDVDGTSFSTSPTASADYWDQRFRLQLKIKPADGITAVLRGDFTEGRWGAGGMPIGEKDRPEAGTNEVIMIDKAYVQIKKSIVTVTAGLQGYSLGDSFGYNNQTPGLQIKIAPKPVSFRIGFAKVDEGGSLSDETAANEDINHYWGDFGFKTKGFSINLYGAMQVDDNGATADEPTMAGLLVKAKAGPLNIKAFLESFGGDNGAGVDYMGMQFYGDISMKMGSKAKLGVELVYSDGEDNSGTEEKRTRMPNAYAGYRTYADRGPVKGTVTLLPYGSANDMFNLTGDAGSLGGRFYADFKVIPQLTLSANLGYFEEDEDKNSQESVLTYGGSILWAMAPKTTLGAGYMAWSPDEDPGVTLDDYTALYGILKVKF